MSRPEDELHDDVEPARADNSAVQPVPTGEPTPTGSIAGDQEREGPGPPPALVPSSAGVSARMSRQRRKDTEIEVAVRKLLHASGLRYRVGLPVPGMRRRTIDVAFTRAKVAVFLDGCFWHGCPEHATRPKANSSWWATKLDRNIARDTETSRHLEEAGWLVLRFWEHQSPESVAVEIASAVSHTRPPAAGS